MKTTTQNPELEARAIAAIAAANEEYRAEAAAAPAEWRECDETMDTIAEEISEKHEGAGFGLGYEHHEDGSRTFWAFYD